MMPSHDLTEDHPKWVVFVLIFGWLGLVFIGCQHAVAQTIHHQSYTVYFNPKLRCPDSCSWDLSSVNVSCGKVVRIDEFSADPALANSPKPADFVQLPGYVKGSPLEGAKGHLRPFEESRCNPIDYRQCFFVDQMYWQYQLFNAGDWKEVESYEQELAKTETMHVIAGYIGITQTLRTGIPIVSYMYKAIHHANGWECWIMPNLPTSKGHKYDYWHVTTCELDSKTGLRL